MHRAKKKKQFQIYKRGETRHTLFVNSFFFFKLTKALIVVVAAFFLLFVVLLSCLGVDFFGIENVSNENIFRWPLFSLELFGFSNGSGFSIVNNSLNIYSIALYERDNFCICSIRKSFRAAWACVCVCMRECASECVNSFWTVNSINHKARNREKKLSREKYPSYNWSAC